MSERMKSCSYLIYIRYIIHNVQCQDLKRGFTTPHKCATVDSSRRNQPSDRDGKAREKLQEKVSDFQVTFNDNVYLSLGLEAK